MAALLLETPVLPACSGNHLGLPVAAETTVAIDTTNSNYEALMQWLTQNNLPSLDIAPEVAPHSPPPEPIKWDEFLTIPVGSGSESEVAADVASAEGKADNFAMEEIFAMFQQAINGFDGSSLGSNDSWVGEGIPIPVMDSHFAQILAGGEMEVHTSTPTLSYASATVPLPSSPPTPSLASPFSKGDSSASPAALRTPLSDATQISSNWPLNSSPLRSYSQRKGISYSKPKPKPYDRPTKKRQSYHTKLHASIDPAQYSPSELARIMSRSQHKQRKEAHIIDTRKAGTHIEVPRKDACESCAKNGYDCLVPRLEDLGWGKLVSKLGFCAGCHSNRGDCTFTKRPDRRVAAYESAYRQNQKGFAVHKNGMVLVKSEASKFTLAHLLNGEWKRPVFTL